MKLNNLLQLLIKSVSLAILMLLLSGNTHLAAAEPETGPKAITLDDAVRQTFPSPPSFPFCSDSYLSEEPRSWNTGERETEETRLAHLAETFERVRFRAGSFQLLRYGRWYDPTLTRIRKDTSRRLPQETTIKRNDPGANGAITVEVKAFHTSLSDLCRTLQKTTGEPHAALGWIAERRVTLLTTSSTTADLRAALARLFVDCRWVKDQQTWLFKERPDADRIRQIAEAEGNRSRRLEEWAEAGLKTQLAADLTPAQWKALEQGETLTMGWDQLSSGGRSLLTGWGRAFVDTILARSNGSPESFADLRRTQDLGVRLNLVNGRIKVKSFGRTASGIAVIW